MFLDETHILMFLVQVFVLLALAKGFGELLRRIGQPPLAAELLVGIALGPTILGRFFPGIHQTLFPSDPTHYHMLSTVSWFGVLFLLLETGLDFDISTAWAQKGKAALIAVMDIIIPMVVAFIPSLFLPEKYLMSGEQRWIFALFMASVMTISAMPVSARIMHDLNILKSKLGFLTMSALAINDIIGWLLFTVVLGLYAQTKPSAGSIGAVLGTTVGFALIALTLGRYISTRAFDMIKRSNMPEPGTSLTFVCLIGMLFGAFTQGMGIHALFGFFIAGIVVGEARSLSRQTRSTISQIVHAIFVPLFFVSIGLKVDFWKGFDLPIVVFVCFIGITGRYMGAWFGARITNLAATERNALAIAHSPGGMMEIVVAVLALENNLITLPIFVAIVVAAVLSSIIVGPWMSLALKNRTAQLSKV